MKSFDSQADKVIAKLRELAVYGGDSAGLQLVAKDYRTFYRTLERRIKGDWTDQIGIVSKS